MGGHEFRAAGFGARTLGGESATYSSFFLSHKLPGRCSKLFFAVTKFYLAGSKFSTRVESELCFEIRWALKSTGFRFSIDDCYGLEFFDKIANFF